MDPWSPPQPPQPQVLHLILQADPNRTASAERAHREVLTIETSLADVLKAAR